MFGGALTGAAPPQPAAEHPAAGQAPTAIRYVRSVEADTLRPATGNVSTASQPGSFVRREWIDIKLTGPGGLNRAVDRTLYEAAGETTPPRAEHRRYTILVVPGPVSRSYVDGEIGRWRGALKLDEWRDETAGLQQQARSDDGARAAVVRAAAIDAAAGKAAGDLMTLEFAANSDALTDQIAYPNQIAVVRPLPRILIASAETRTDESGHVGSAVSLDLRLDEVQAYPYPGFPTRAAALFLAARGMQESVLEGQLLARWSGRGEAVSTAALMAEATRKRVRLLVGAAARLRDRIPGLEVRIVGRGPEEARLRRLGGTVRWLGDVTQAELAAEYNRADMFCLPSVQEGFGIVFLEAMAAGKPIVAARAAAVPEVVPQGLLVRPDDEEALAAGIEQVYRDHNLRRELARAGRSRVEEFDAPRVAARFIEEIRGRSTHSPISKSGIGE